MKTKNRFPRTITAMVTLTFLSSTNFIIAPATAEEGYQESSHNRGPAAIDQVEAPSDSDIREQLQKVLENFIAATPESPGVSAAIDCDAINLHWRGSAGYTSLDREIPLTVDRPYRLASTTKTYVAAAILRLMEQDKLKLDDSIDKHLPWETLNIVKRDYNPGAITIRNLLTHTAGLADHARDTNYAELMIKNPERHWTAIEQITLAVDGASAVGYPGGQFRYSDTGYVLLGQIIEYRTKKSLAAALRSLLKFKQLRLDATWLEFIEPWPKGVPQRPAQFYGEVLNTSNLHPSMDLYGGGGLVATMADVSVFYSALFEGQVFEDPNTLWMMRSSLVTDSSGASEFEFEGQGPTQYSLGLLSWVYQGNTVFEHGGAWGTNGGYVPNLGMSFAWSIGNGAVHTHIPWVKQMLGLVAEELATNR